MSLAFCLYYAQDRRQLTSYPKVLLFDEIDAPLHPSMSRRLLQVITDVLVRQHGINVILATHSISTVALASEGSVFPIRTGQPGVHPLTKAAALSILTA
jgi:ABC-type methionine transport system ATPase subunit